MCDRAGSQCLFLYLFFLFLFLKVKCPVPVVIYYSVWHIWEQKEKCEMCIGRAGMREHEGEMC